MMVLAQVVVIWCVMYLLHDVTPVPPVLISRGRIVIFDIVEYIIIEWTMTDESRICRICRRVLILKNKRRVLLASLPWSSIGQKRDGLKKVNKEEIVYPVIFFFSRLRFEISRLRLRFLAGWDLPRITGLLSTLSSTRFLISLHVVLPLTTAPFWMWILIIDTFTHSRLSSWVHELFKGHRSTL
jgi:hypothetical protein